MLKLVIAYFLTTLVFLSIDLLWLGLVAKNFYQSYLSQFLSDKVNWTAALIFYLLYVIGIFIFAIMPAVNKESLTHAIIMGALFGFFTYTTYDLTNLATLKDWPMTIVIVDILWGSFLCGSVSTAGYFITRALDV